MGVWIGIDGGGTKTKFLSASKDGKRLRTYTTGGTYYHLNGIDTVCARLREGVDAVRCGEPVLGICYGMPSFGEGGAADGTAVARIREALAPYPLHVVNDVEVGWAGSMALAPGVNIVAGTGSIAYGRDEAGNSARSGGWMEFFSDEGSGYWLGRRAFQLFAKQSDGRVPRGRLHALMKARLGLKDDYELNNLVRDVYAPSREKTASIQRILLEAAREGDASAVRLYEEAARELAENVNAVLRQLRLGDTPTVSYSGGIFETGDLILKPFRAALGRMHRVWITRTSSPAAAASSYTCIKLAGLGWLVRGSLLSSARRTKNSSFVIVPSSSWVVPSAKVTDSGTTKMPGTDSCSAVRSAAESVTIRIMAVTPLWACGSAACC